MSELIAINSLRNGLGRTTIACLLGTKLSEHGKKTLIIDNNYRHCDVASYFLVKPNYTIDDIKPFLQGKSLEKDTLKELTISANKNLDILAGSRLDTMVNVLNGDDIKEIKERSEGVYDYIIVDTRAALTQEENISLMDIIDYPIILAQANQNEQANYIKQKNNLPDNKKTQLEKLINKAIVVINRYIDEIDFDLSYFKKSVGEIVKIYFSANIINYCNGHNCKLTEQNEIELMKLIKYIADIDEENKNDKNGGLTKKIKSIFGVI